MRRWIASVVIAVFGLGLIGPAVPAFAENPSQKITQQKEKNRKAAKKTKKGKKKHKKAKKLTKKKKKKGSTSSLSKSAGSVNHR